MSLLESYDGSNYVYPESMLDSPRDVAIVYSPDSIYWQDAEEIEFEVFRDCGYVDSKAELAEDYDKYLGVTAFGLTSVDGNPAGSVRMIFHDSDVGFKTLNDASEGLLHIDEVGLRFLESNVDLDRSMEVGTISIPRSLRGVIEGGIRINTDLYGAIYGMAKANDVDWIIASFDGEYLNRFGSIFGSGVRRLGPAVDYMGSPTVPVAIHIDQAMQCVVDLGLKDTFDSIVSIGAQLKHEH